MAQKLKDFIPAEYPGVFYDPSGNADTFTYSDSDAAENELLNILKSVEDKSSDSVELERSIHNWTTRYHLSSARSNIIRAMDFITSDSKILEIGSGCGAVTRFLGENFSSVDAVEGSYRRACIAAERCNDLGNVRIFNSPLQDISFDKTYDVVMLIGVLEWAPVFYSDKGACEMHKGRHLQSNAENACLAMLEHACSALNENGILLVAIENKLGLKYWSGCREDHTGGFFDGINGYPKENTPVTFSRHELIKLMETAALNHHEFYYPFPDYKLASTIIREVDDPASYYLHNWLTEPFRDNSAQREYHFHEGLAIKSLIKSDLFYEFANSFLVAASFNPDAFAEAKTSNWIARKYSSPVRLPEFRTITELKRNKDNLVPFVDKQKLYQGQRSEVLFKFNPESDKWISGDLLQFSLLESLFQQNPLESFIEVFKTYSTALITNFSIDEKDTDGYPVLASNVLDFLPFNIIIKDDELKGFDLEWLSSKPICADYMLFRALFHFSIQQAYFVFQKISVPNNDIDALFILIIKRFYPNYNLNRHLHNRKLEEEFQSFVSGKQEILPSSEDFVTVVQSPYEKILSSWSWKVTAPFRLLRTGILNWKIAAPVRFGWRLVFNRSEK